MFDQSCNLNKHYLTHLGHKPYTCSWPLCGEKFSQSSNLTKHLKKHTGNKFFSNEITQNFTLNPFKCDHQNCQASFSSASLLIEHKMKHLIESKDEDSESSFRANDEHQKNDSNSSQSHHDEDGQKSKTSLTSSATSTSIATSLSSLNPNQIQNTMASLSSHEMVQNLINSVAQSNSMTSISHPSIASHQHHLHPSSHHLVRGVNVPNINIGLSFGVNVMSSNNDLVPVNLSTL